MILCNTVCNLSSVVGPSKRTSIYICEMNCCHHVAPQIVKKINRSHICGKAEVERFININIFNIHILSLLNVICKLYKL